MTIDPAAIAAARALLVPRRPSFDARLEDGLLVARAALEGVDPDDAQREAHGGSIAAQLRKAGRGRAGVPRFTCWQCHKLGVPSPIATCGKCGYDHGGINHHAVSVS